jgi:chemotaxis protein histidine kinase CheA
MAGTEQRIVNGRKVGGKYMIINPPHAIATKVSGSGPMSERMVKNADFVLKKHAEAYANTSKILVEKLAKIVEQLDENSNGQKQIIQSIFNLTHNIRGQGGTFGYDLITDIAASLCEFTDELDTCDAKAIKLINAHVDALRAVIMENATGDGGDTGKAISQSLGLAVHKLTDY